ncbi:MAG: hypothetical protein KC708_10185 [Anaerolineae bacterium]|nr:hypothetical protein [Anaerolineae bacterium]
MSDVGSVSTQGSQPDETAMPIDEQEESRRQAIKTARVLIRQFSEHVRQRHLLLGATEDQVGFVDVITHRMTGSPILNYVAPRRNTAWVSGKHISEGLAILKKQGHPGVFMYPDVLFPPIFSNTLTELGLQHALDVPIYAYKSGHRTFSAPVLPTAITIQPISQQRSMGNWWYIWRNDQFEITSSAVDPMQLAYDLHREPTANQINLVVRRYNFPIGAARITLNENSAHIATSALLHDADTIELSHLLLAYSLQHALNSGREVIFVSGLTPLQAEDALSLGFVDVGNIVCYAESATMFNNMKGQHGSLAQPVLIP